MKCYLTQTVILAGPSSPPSPVPSVCHIMSRPQHCLLRSYPQPVPLLFRAPSPAEPLHQLSHSPPPHTPGSHTDTSLISASHLPHTLLLPCHHPPHRPPGKQHHSLHSKGPFQYPHPKASPLTTPLQESPTVPFLSVVTAASPKSGF